MKGDCVRAADVLAEMTTGPAPELSDTDLTTHVNACESCRDLVAVVSALRGERDHLRREASLPSAGLVWWRARLRERQDASRLASAPVTLAHAAALVGVVVLAAALASTLGRSAGFDIPWTTDLLPSVPSWAQASQAVSATSPLVRVGLVLGAGVWLILGPVALYLAIKRQ